MITVPYYSKNAMRQSPNFGPNQIPHPPIPVPGESVETFAQYDYEISIRSLFYDILFLKGCRHDHELL